MQTTKKACWGLGRQPGRIPLPLPNIKASTSSVLFLYVNHQASRNPIKGRCEHTNDKKACWGLGRQPGRIHLPLPNTKASTSSVLFLYVNHQASRHPIKGRCEHANDKKGVLGAGSPARSNPSTPAKYQSIDIVDAFLYVNHQASSTPNPLPFFFLLFLVHMSRYDDFLPIERSTQW